MEKLRRDAARTRERILEAARVLAADGQVPRLNTVASAADVGVGTVYRHFATVAELEEALVWDRFDALDQILDAAGPGQLDEVLSAHFALLVEDPLFERVTARPTQALDHTAELRAALVDKLAELMARAESSGHLRPDVTATDVLLLLCGAAHSARSVAVVDGAQSAILLRVVLDGLRSTRTRLS